MGKIGLTSNILRNKIPRVIKGNKRKPKSRLHWDILDKKRLALQIKHRRSVDFDFYNQNEFDAAKIYQTFQRQKSEKLLLYTTAENTLILEVNSVGISLFTYKYLLLKPFVVTEYLNLASLEDISAMKLIAII